MRTQLMLVAALICGAPILAFAQEETHGSVDVTGQSVRGDTRSSKFDEYSDVVRGVYVDRFGLQVEGTTYYLLLSGSKPGLKDQRTEIETGRRGLHKLSLSYDQIPHDLSNTAHTFLIDRGNGRFTLPDNMQSSLQTSSANAPGFFSDTPLVPVSTERKKASVSYSYNPVGKWRLNLGYEGEKKQGDKVIGVTYGHGQIEEALEPVDYQTHLFRFQSEYVEKDFGLSAAYELSTFSNGTKSLTVDNPFRLSDGAVSASGSSTPGTARLALPPDNVTHQASLAMNGKASANSRLSATVGYTLQQQNDTFLPLTSNTNILNDPRLPGLPAPSLDGDVRTLNSTVKWNWKPNDRTSINVYGKDYNVDNRTPNLAFQQYVSYDTSFSTGPPTTGFNPTRSRTSLPIDYNKTNVGADYYRALTKALSVKLAYDWERWDRRFREANTTNEHRWTAGFKLGPLSSLVLRPTYTYARKTASSYSADQVDEATYPLGLGTSLGQIQDLRKFDEAGRRRHKVDVRADWNPTDSVNVGLDYGLAMDKYDAEFGLRDSQNVYYSVDTTYTPTELWSLYADYTWEQSTANTLSRYRTTGLDVAANNWIGRLQDTVHTLNTGVTYVLVKEKLNADMGWSMSYAKGVQEAANPNAPLVGTASQIASATATNLPNTYTRWNRVRAALRYKCLKNLTAKLGYEYQRYSETDWAQDDLTVYQTTFNKSVFLGATQGSYEAHLASLGLSYTF